MERDTDGFAAGELPTYNELAAQSSPNSRFGRWKSWVEKRAAERYTDESLAAREARRLKGWGPQADTEVQEPAASASSQLQVPTRGVGLGRTQTVLSTPPPLPDTDAAFPSSSSQVTIGEALPPSHLRLHSFGSRFLPHSEQPILSCLPLFNHQKLLLGHIDGLNLLDMDPEVDSSELGSREPRRRDIWLGEGVYQMEILEYEQVTPSGTPMGVVLALVGAESAEAVYEKDVAEPHKTIRMYNLASLASLVRWAAVRKDNKPLDLSRPADWQPQQKRHRHHLSKGFMSFQSSQPQPSTVPPPPPPKDWPRPSHTKQSSLGLLDSPDLPDSPDSWDIVGDDDAPLRWATDFVPLASPSSRLASHSVLLFELQQVTNGGRVTARLAVATRQHIFLYETVRGERAFRFVKEFYTPIPARGITFLEQSVYDPPTKTAMQGTRHSLDNVTSDYASRRVPSPVPVSPPRSAPKAGQLSLFVIFEKKAGLIKISDSSVGEIELWEEPGHSRSSSSVAALSTGSSFKRSLQTPESPKDNKGMWAPPAEAVLPLARAMARSSFTPERDTLPVYLVTRGKTTHIVRAPLPMPLAGHVPLTVLFWGMRPSRVVPRVCEHPASGVPFLQVTALGEDGVEVQEVDLGFAREAGGRGKGRAGGVVSVQADVGAGGAGFLCAGGHWTEATRRVLERRESTATVDTVEMVSRRRREAGFYAWTRYAINDWRVFWLGGDADDGEVPPQTP